MLLGEKTDSSAEVAHGALAEEYNTTHVAHARRFLRTLARCGISPVAKGSGCGALAAIRTRRDAGADGFDAAASSSYLSSAFPSAPARRSTTPVSQALVLALR